MYGNITNSFFRAWRQHTAMQIATLSVLAGTFTVVTLAFLAHQNLSNILSQWGNSVRMSVYLQDSIGDEQVSKIEKAINDTGIFSEIEFVSKKQAAIKFTEQMASYAPGFLSEIEGDNPLPMSFEMNLKEEVSGAGNVEGLQSVASLLGDLAGVDEVSYGQGWVENYASLVSSFTTTSWVVVLLLLAGSLLVVGNSIRNSIFQRREEIEILELIGATRSYIRSPYIAEGSLLGFFASVLALVFCYFLFSWQSQLIDGQLGFLGLGSSLGYLTPTRIFIVLLLGTGFGALGAYMCLRKISTGWAAAKNVPGWTDQP